MGIIVVKHNGNIACIPSWCFRDRDIYEIICRVNKPHNLYYVSIIKKYFENKA